MKFGLLQNQFFGTSYGAYSLVTGTEVGDSQITLTDDEAVVAKQFFGEEGIYRGNVKTGKEKAAKTFHLFGTKADLSDAKPIKLNLVFPKPDKNELRLYLKGSLFKPKPGKVWFIFPQGDKIVLGDMPEIQWRSLGRDDPEDEFYIETIYHDAVIPPSYKTVPSRTALVRNPALAVKSFERSCFKCEVDPGHKAFTSRSTGKPFLEAHHLIPLKYQKSYGFTLDYENNIAALCPNCHRAVHHATAQETKALVNVLFSKRATDPNIISLTLSGLYRLYSCEDLV